jgi:hypothetical protein
MPGSKNQYFVSGLGHKIDLALDPILTLASEYTSTGTIPTENHPNHYRNQYTWNVRMIPETNIHMIPGPMSLVQIRLNEIYSILQEVYQRHVAEDLVGLRRMQDTCRECVQDVLPLIFTIVGPVLPGISQAGPPANYWPILEAPFDFAPNGLIVGTREEGQDPTEHRIQFEWRFNNLNGVPDTFVDDEDEDRVDTFYQIIVDYDGPFELEVINDYNT